MKHILYIFLLIFGIQFSSKAQLSFPSGTTKRVVTSESYLYFETGIEFNITNGKIGDYRWQWISDSIDSNWEVSSCMNGECLNGFPQSGTFTNINKAPDTTGYIRFHVDSKDFEGKSTIRYNVYRNDNLSDAATLEFNFTYVRPNSIEVESKVDVIEVYPNPAINTINIQKSSSKFGSSNYIIYNMLGEPVKKGATDDFNTPLDISVLPVGVYQLVVQQINKLCVQKQFVKWQ